MTAKKIAYLNDLTGKVDPSLLPAGIGDYIEAYVNGGSSGNPALVTATDTAIALVSTDHVVGTSLELAGDGTILVNEDGIYACSGFVQSPPTGVTTGYLAAYLACPAWAEPVTASAPLAASILYGVAVPVTTVHRVLAGQKITLHGWQNSGADMGFYAALTVIKVAALPT